MSRAPIAHWRSSDQTPQYLAAHLLGVGALTRDFASKLNFPVAGELIGILHDLGKYSSEFQSYISSALGLTDSDADDYVDAEALKGKVDHSTAGAQFIWRVLGDRGPFERTLAQVLSLCIASHHSGLIDCLGIGGEDTFDKRMRKSNERTHIDQAIKLADVAVLDRASQLVSSSALMAELKTLVENVVHKNPQRMVLQQKLGLAVRFLFSCLIDADRIDTADFEHKSVRKYRPKGDYVAWPVLIARLEDHLQSMNATSSIDRLRRDISSHCFHAASRPSGIYTLTVPTGGGKTLASLRFALHHAKQQESQRIIYVIPFTSIIDQNAQVVREILEPADVPAHHGKIVLEHHSSITPEQQTWREKVLCENWDAPVVYTTMVQFLESLFGAGTRGARRMHQMANAVLIFDEIQTLPIKCVHLFNNAINFLAEHCNTTVVLCTATQPTLHKVSPDRGSIRLAPLHEIMPDVRALFRDLKRVEVRDGRKPGGWSYDEIARLAAREMTDIGSCLVIVNTKDAAKQIFGASRSLVLDETLVHLSTDMCPAHRKNELAKVRGRLAMNLPALCVSTQLIEAGVDIDFGAVIRLAAGIDSIAQAAGRCNRNARRAMGTLHVVNPQVERLSNLPDIAVGRQIAERVLDDFRENPDRYQNDLFSPEALADFYNYYFFARKDEMSYCVPAKTLGRDDTILNLLSGNTQSVEEFQRCNQASPQRLLNQAFMTAAKSFRAIDAPTQGVVVPYGAAGRALVARLYGAYDIELDFSLVREAQQFTVNVFPHILEKLKLAGAVKEVKPDTRILTVDERYYSPLFGLTTEPVSSMEALYVQ